MSIPQYEIGDVPQSLPLCPSLMWKWELFMGRVQLRGSQGCVVQFRPISGITGLCPWSLW